MKITSRLAGIIFLLISILFLGLLAVRYSLSSPPSSHSSLPPSTPTPVELSLDEQIQLVSDYQHLTADYQVIIGDKSTGAIEVIDTQYFPLSTAIAGRDDIYVQPDFLYDIETNDSRFSHQYALENTGQNFYPSFSTTGISGTSGADMSVPAAWEITGDREIIVAVVDTGVDWQHPDLINRMWDGTNCVSDTGAYIGGCLGGYTYSQLAATPSDQLDPSPHPDCAKCYHGTHVAGIIGAQINNGQGIAGVGKNVKIMALNVANLEGKMRTSDIVKGINFAKNNGAEIINASLGTLGTSCSSLTDVAFYTAIKNFPGTFVASAGNDGVELDGINSLHRPSSYAFDTSCWQGLDNAISVGNSDYNDERTSSSNYGHDVHLFAPGRYIVSTLPGNTYGYLTGTSMAAPNVSAVASLILSTRPVSPVTTKDLLMTSVDKKPNLSSVAAGRVNAAAAVSLLSSLPDPTATNSQINIGAFASYVSGYSNLILSGAATNVTQGRTLTVQYQIDATNGTWSNLTSLTARASNQSWSSHLTLPPGLATGSHTIYVRVFDGFSYSVAKSTSFVLDVAPPSATASLLNGVKCVGDTSIYCTPPTGINLSAAADNQSGIGAYRTQWTYSFTDLATPPLWTLNQPPSNFPTTNHTSAGNHTLFYQIRDKVGNTSPVKDISYYVNDRPTLTLDNTDHFVSSYHPLALSGTFHDLDASQSATVSVTINNINYQTQTYPTTTASVAWSLIINASSLKDLSPTQLTNLPVTVKDSAGASSIAYYTGQITVTTALNSRLYLPVMRNTPFSITLGKAGAFNLLYGTNQGITVSPNAAGEIVVSGQLSEPAQIPFGTTTLVFTVLDTPSTMTVESLFVIDQAH